MDIRYKFLIERTQRTAEKFPVYSEILFKTIQQHRVRCFTVDWISASVLEVKLNRADVLRTVYLQL